MKRAKQKDFFESQREYAPRRHTHGGAGVKGLRKIKRPLDSKKPLHLVLKSSHAKERLSLLSFKNQPFIQKTFSENAKRFGIKVHGFENVGNHLHAVLSFKRAEDFQNFLRTVTALIARKVTGAKKGKPFGKRFWDHLAFTRVIVGRKAFAAMGKYLRKNEVEREFGDLARLAIEQYERAERQARKRGCDVWEILESGSA